MSYGGYRNYVYNKRKAVRRTVARSRAQQRGMRQYWNSIGPAGIDGSTRQQHFGKDWGSASETQKTQRRAYGYRGRGDYYSDTIKPLLQKYIPSGSFSKAGGFLGGMFGGGLGSTAGAALGGMASKYVGFGDYQPTTVNQLMGGGSGVTVNASDDLTGDLYFSHKEFLQNVSVTGSAATSSTFQLQSYQLNPGLVKTFPFLSQLAQNFVLYEMQGLIFEYKPTSGESGTTNNSLGKVIMATGYDPTAPNFVNSIQMENYDYATSSKPSNPQLHGVETKNSQQFGNMQYIRTGPVTRDLVFTDIGNFQIATEGVPLGTSTSVILGELWVTYRVKLSRSNLFGSLLCLNSATDSFLGANASGAVVGSTTQALTVADWNRNSYTINYTPNQFFAKNSNNLGCSVIGINTTQARLSFPVNIVQGQYLIMWYVATSTGQTLNNITPSTNFLVNCTQANFAPKEANASDIVTTMRLGVPGESTLMMAKIINVVAPGNLVASIVLSLNVSPEGDSRHYVTVQCVNYNFTQLT